MVKPCKSCKTPSAHSEAHTIAGERGLRTRTTVEDQHYCVNCGQPNRQKPGSPAPDQITSSSINSARICVLNMPTTTSDDNNGTKLSGIIECTSSRNVQTRQKKQQSRSSSSLSAKSVTTTHAHANGVRQSVKFGALPLQQSQVLQQLQSLSLSSTSAAPPTKASSARQVKDFIPKRKPAASIQPKLRSFKFDPASNTDSEVDSPVSQPAAHQHHHSHSPLPRRLVPSPLASQSVPEVLDACSACNNDPLICTAALRLPATDLSQASESASARTPARTAPQILPDSIIDTPDSMAMSTPVCGQAPPGSTSPAMPMSCSTTDLQSIDHLRNAAALFGSPMCISPDTWAMPQQLQWELSSDSLPAAQNEAEVHAPTPTASQMQAADLQFGLDAINQASAAAANKANGSLRRSRLASSTMADQLAELPNDAGSKRQHHAVDGQIRGVDRESQGSDRGFGGFAEEADWLDDLEVTPTPSQDESTDPSWDSSCHQADLQLALDSDDESPQQALDFQVRLS